MSIEIFYRWKEKSGVLSMGLTLEGTMCIKRSKGRELQVEANHFIFKRQVDDEHLKVSER